MKTLFNRLRFLILISCVVALILPVVMAPLMLGGCAGTPNRVAYQGAVIQRTSVETGLGLFNEWVKAQKSNGVDTTATQVKVQKAFQDWKDATILALQAGRLNAVGATTNAAGQTGVGAAFQDALNNSAALKADFFQLLADIGVGIPGVTPTAKFTPLK